MHCLRGSSLHTGNQTTNRFENSHGKVKVNLHPNSARLFGVHNSFSPAWLGGNLICNDYLYQKDRLYPTKQHCRCTVSGCSGRCASGRLHTDLADPPGVMKNVQQNHIADEVLTRSRRTKEELCTAAQQRPL